MLRTAFGEEADFRDGQWEAITKTLQPTSRLLVVESTGWGKSAVYFLATLALRRQGSMALIVSPLLALMRNQLELAEKMGVRAAAINSANVKDWEGVEARILTGEVDALFVSPERLANERFRSKILGSIIPKVGLLVIDEAHCVSDWGHDFRPDYKRVMRIVPDLPSSASVLATTATANERVIQDLKSQFGETLQIQRGKLMRKSIRLSAFDLPLPEQRLAWLAKYLPRFDGTGIVYTLTIHDAEMVSAWLKQQGHEVEAYHGVLDPEERLRLEDAFSQNQLKALIATSALGMGYDKPDVGFVVHYQMPGSPVAYYQQVGRAGRGLETAFGVLLVGQEDEDIAEHFRSTSSPPKSAFEAVFRALSASPLPLHEIVEQARLRQSIVQQCLDILDAEGHIRSGPDGHTLLPSVSSFDLERSERVRAQREEEMQQMKAYAQTQKCRMVSLAQLLHDEANETCGRCDNCKPLSPIKLDEDFIEAARRFMMGLAYEIEAKKMLPIAQANMKSRRIPAEQQVSPGLALSSYGDPEWGRMVREGKYQEDAFGKELIDASLVALRRYEIKPDWVTWVPSSRHPHLLKRFAEQIAAELGVPATEAVTKVESNQPQKLMLSTAAQFSNVWDAFEVSGARPGTVLLVDDVVDSGWTLSAIGRKLRLAGADKVIPFALATARPRRQR
ncbi:MAG: RecQ family ATP-dependent DNA helicase [Fimbriimonadaceae bacterium]|nr:RecQ family ATP-dependent DNA helicase [Fimbriimonadaceae bacterium]